MSCTLGSRVSKGYGIRNVNSKINVIFKVAYPQKNLVNILDFLWFMVQLC